MATYIGSVLQTITAAANWFVRVTENFRSVSPAALYGIDPGTTTGLTLGYLGGNFNGTTPANGTVTLAASTTNYVVAHRTTGVVTAATSTTNWLDTTTYLQLYQIVTGASTMTSISDMRQAIGASGGGGGGGGMTNPMTTAGDVIIGGTSGTPARLGAGTNGHVLTLASGAPVWQAVAGGGFTGGTLTSALNEAKGTDIVRAATTDIGAATGNFVHLTGTTTITALGTIQAGTRRVVRFAGAGTLTHNATSLILPGAANITTAANDCAIFLSEGAGNWRCVAYTKANGQSIAATAPASLTNFTGSLATTTPNNLTNAARLLVTGGTADGDFVAQPKGIGSFLLQLPDATTTGGDKRGSSSADLQLARTASTQVASGQSSFAAGMSNTAAGYASGAFGEANNVSGTYAAGFGSTHTVSGYGAAALGGSANVVDGQRAAAVAGNYLHTRGLVGMVAFGAAGQSIAAANRRQAELHAFGARTANATPVQMGSEGNAGSSNNQILLNAMSAVTVQGTVTAMNSAGDTKGWFFSATVKRLSGVGTTAVVGTPVVTVTGNDAGASTWALAIIADTTYGGLGIRVTGQAATTIDWTGAVTASFNSQ